MGSSTGTCPWAHPRSGRYPRRSTSYPGSPGSHTSPPPAPPLTSRGRVRRTSSLPPGPCASLPSASFHPPTLHCCPALTHPTAPALFRQSHLLGLQLQIPGPSG